MAYAMAILFIGGMIFMSQGCAAVRDTSEIVATVKATMAEVDRDGSGSISAMEIVMYLIGYDMTKKGGAAGLKGVARFRNGRKQRNNQADENSGSA
jgi:hypothetical protein